MQKYISLLLSCVFCLIILSGCEPAVGPQNTEAQVSATEDSGQIATTPVVEGTNMPAMSGPENGRRYSDEEIASIFAEKELSIVEIRDIYGSTLVQFYPYDWYPEESVSCFAWFDRETGETQLIVSGISAIGYDVRPNKNIKILTSGQWYVNGHQYFPELIISEVYDVFEMDYIDSRTENYYMPIEQSFTLGVYRPECLTGIAFETENVALGFAEQPGKEADFYAAYCSIPQMNVSFSEGVCTIILYNTVLSENFTAPAIGEGTIQRSFLSVECDGEDTVVTLAVGEGVERYNVDAAEQPVTGLPYAMISFASNAQYSHYPAGW